jgi:hypothetical protein
MVSISKYPQWISKMVKRLYFLVKMWKKKFMFFHKANKLSSNITWIHSRTLNVVPYFQNRALRGRADVVQQVYNCDKWWTHVLSIRVEPSIIKHVLITQQFPIFSTFINQIERFLCPWMCKLKGYKCFFNIRNKGATQKT